MSILVIADHDNAALKNATLNTVGAASKIGGDVVVLVAGSGCEAAAKAAAAIAGVSKVLMADAPYYKDALAENLAALVVGIASGYSHILSPATAMGKSVTPRIAALLEGKNRSERESLLRELFDEVMTKLSRWQQATTDDDGGPN